MPIVRFEVYIQPRAARTGFAGMHDGIPKIRIAAPPIENAANHALVEFIAGLFGVAKGCVRVVRGGTSRRKVLEVEGVTAEQVHTAWPPESPIGG
jgi:uncharacterized protein (TIGR00251 family)